MKTYDVIYNNKTVGSAKVTTEGLYYKIVCSCALSKPAMYRAYVITEGTNVDLGICVPAKDSYCLLKRIPKKLIVGEDIRFYVSDKEAFDSSKAFQIKEGQPFEHIDKLENAHTEVRNDQLYLVISELTDQL